MEIELGVDDFSENGFLKIGKRVSCTAKAKKFGIRKKVIIKAGQMVEISEEMTILEGNQGKPVFIASPENIVRYSNSIPKDFLSKMVRGKVELCCMVEKNVMADFYGRVEITFVLKEVYTEKTN